MKIGPRNRKKLINTSRPTNNLDAEIFKNFDTVNRILLKNVGKNIDQIEKHI